MLKIKNNHCAKNIGMCHQNKFVYIKLLFLAFNNHIRPFTSLEHIMNTPQEFFVELKIGIKNKYTNKQQYPKHFNN